MNPIYGAIIKVKGRRGHIQITSPAQGILSFNKLTQAIKDKALFVADGLRGEGKEIEYIHLGLISSNRRTYDLLEIL